MERVITLYSGLLILLIVFNTTEATTSSNSKKTSSSHSEAFMRNLTVTNHICSKALDKFFESEITQHDKFKEFFEKDEKGQENEKQFIAAVRVSVEVNGAACHLAMKGDGLLFWENRSWKDFKNDDCDGTCQPPISNLMTKGTSIPLSNKRQVHTELQMLYGNKGRNELMVPAQTDSDIIIMYSRSIPCSQLPCIPELQSAYAECAGDMKNYRYEKMKDGSRPGPMIISIYTRVYNDPQVNCHTRTNEQVSNLYLEIGGIPSFQSDIDENKILSGGSVGKLVLKNQGFTKYFTEPSSQIFPRLTFAKRETFDKNRRVVKCVVEDDLLLSEVAGVKYVRQEFARWAEEVPLDVSRETTYRYIVYIFEEKQKSKKAAEKQELRKFLEIPKLYETRYDVCDRFGQYNFGLPNNREISEEKDDVLGKNICEKVLKALTRGIFDGVIAEVRDKFCKKQLHKTKNKNIPFQQNIAHG